MKKYKLRQWVKDTLLIIGLLIALVALIIVFKSVTKKMDNQALGNALNNCETVTTRYTNLGDKYYVCLDK